MPLLKKSAQVVEKDLKYDVLMSTARCAMSLDQTETAVRALLELNRASQRGNQELIFIVGSHPAGVGHAVAGDLQSVARGRHFLRVPRLYGSRV